MYPVFHKFFNCNELTIFQLLGLVRFSLRYLALLNHHETYTSLRNEAIGFGEEQHVEYYRWD